MRPEIALRWRAVIGGIAGPIFVTVDATLATEAAPAADTAAQAGAG